MADLLGRLAGSMLNPAVWGIVLAVMLTMRSRPGWARLAVSLCLVLLSAALLYSLDDFSTPSEKARGTVLGLFAAVLWFGIFQGVAGLWRQR
jgi:uncharacterized membrane protein YccC